MKTVLLSFVFFAAFAAASTERPSFDEVKSRIRRDHPRLFITRESIPELRKRSHGCCKYYFDRLKRSVDELPDRPVLKVRRGIADFDGEKIVFTRRVGDQDATNRAFECVGGREAAKIALLHLITGDRKYVEKAYRYMMLNLEFAQISVRSRILPEWYNSSRLGALTAYDWLYDELTPEQRKAFIVPMLEHIEYMRNPGYHINGGAVRSGGYGEKGLWWPAGLVAYGGGYADKLAEGFLKSGWDLNCKMMDYREKVSGGKGLLANICTGYSFGWYPWATNLFLHTLKTAAGIDGTKFWTQPREYANYFNWMMIPSRTHRGGFADFGWGDADHRLNELRCEMMYTHLAYGIHFYGEDVRSRALMSLMPEELRIFADGEHPWVAFVLTGFDPDNRFTGDPDKVLNNDIAEFFPSFGLMNMRSGVGYDDTYASVKAGARDDVHQHFDELAFIIYKQGFQALDTGMRWNSAHQMAYYTQTIAHNSLLIRMADEPLPRRFVPPIKFDWDSLRNDGGQNRTRGRNLGMDRSPYHAATAGDATRCYTPAKCREAVRQFVYIKPDYFVIYDRLTSVKPDQQKVFLLHTQNKPVVSGGVWRGAAGTGALFMKTVLPTDAKAEVIGGPDREFWTNGQNFPIGKGIKRALNAIGGIERSWFGRYRIEVSPARADAKARFLTVLQAADGKVPAMVPVENISSGDFDGVRFTTREGVTATVKFRRDGPIGGRIRLENDGKVLLERPLPGSAPLDDRTAGRRSASVDFTSPPRQVNAEQGTNRLTERQLHDDRIVIRGVFAVEDRVVVAVRKHPEFRRNKDEIDRLDDVGSLPETVERPFRAAVHGFGNAPGVAQKRGRGFVGFGIRERIEVAGKDHRFSRRMFSGVRHHHFYALAAGLFALVVQVGVVVDELPAGASVAEKSPGDDASPAAAPRAIPRHIGLFREPEGAVNRVLEARFAVKDAGKFAFALEIGASAADEGIVGIPDEGFDLVDQGFLQADEIGVDLLEQRPAAGQAFFPSVRGRVEIAPDIERGDGEYFVPAWRDRSRHNKKLLGILNDFCPWPNFPHNIFGH